MTARETAVPDVLHRLSFLDSLLSVWIGLAVLVGLGLGRFVPGLQGVLESVKVGEVSLPIALGLLLMMYPVLAKVRYDGDTYHVLAGHDPVLVRNTPPLCGVHGGATGSPAGSSIVPGPGARHADPGKGPD